VVRRWGFLLLLFCGGAVADDAADLKRKAYRQFALGKVEEGRKSISLFLDLYPKHADAAEVALASALSSDLSDDQIGRRIEWLEWIMKEFPKTPLAKRAEDLRDEAVEVQEERAPSGSSIERHQRPGKWIKAERKGGGHSVFRIFRFKPGPLLAALLKMPFDKVAPEAMLGADFKTFRTYLATVKVEFEGDGYSYIKSDFRRPGVYVIEERTSYGRRKSHLVNVQPPNIYLKALGKELVGYCKVSARLFVKSKKGVAHHDVEGLFRVPFPDAGWTFFRYGASLDAFFLRPDSDPAHARVHIATDRPIYRPGHQVRFRAIMRGWKGGAVSLREGGGGKVKVEVRDPQGRVMQSRIVEWSAFGTLTGSFLLGPEPPLGLYTVMAHVPRPEEEGDWLDWEGGEPPQVWFRGFQVKAYRKPDMKVVVRFPATGKDKEKLKARIEADYFFGGAVAGAEVDWYVTRTWQAENFGGDVTTPDPPYGAPDDWWRLLYADEPDDGLWESGAVAEGSGVTNKDGVLEIEFAPEEEGSFVVHAEVRDATNLTAFGEGTVRTGSTLRVRVGADRMWYSPGDAANVTVRVVDADGAPVTGRDVELVAFLEPAEEGWQGWESFFSKKLVTGARGLATCKVPLKEGGTLRLRARAKDDAGRLAVFRAHCAVAGHRLDWVSPDVYPERLVYRPGEKVRLLLRGVKGEQVIFTLEGERFFDVRMVTFDQADMVIELEAKADWAPAVVAKAVWLRNDGCSSEGTEFFVYPAKSRLQVNLATDRAAYGPGQKARVTIRTGEPAEVELAIVDQAVFELKKDMTPHLQSFFWPLREPNPDVDGSFDGIWDNWGSYRSGNPGILDEDSEVPLFGGQADEGPWDEEESAPRTRRRFADTAFWSGTVRTDADGVATIDLDVPDTLTRWRVIARAVAGADRFGIARSEMLTRKAVVARIAAPRFFVEGDSARIGVVVKNGLDSAQEFRVTLDGFGEAQTARIEKDGMRRFDFEVLAERAGELVLRAEARSAAGSDAVERKLPVLSRRVVVREPRSARVEGEWKQVFDSPVVGALEILATGSYGAAVKEALPYLAGYPYGCVEQTMSRFLPAVVAAGALRRAGLRNPGLEAELPRMVDAGLQKLYGFQHDDGGWGWWNDDDTDGWMTAYVVFGLATARQAGIAVDERTLQRGVEALLEMKDPTPFSAYARALAGEKPKKWPVARNENDRACLVLGGRKGVKLQAEVPKKGGSAAVRRVSLVLRALVAADPKDGRIGPLVNWLLAQRRGGAWYSTLDSAYAVLALSSLPLGARVPDAAVTLNGKAVALRDGRATVPLDGRGELVVRGKLFCSTVLRYRGEPRAQPSPDFSLSARFERQVGGKWVAVGDGDAVRVGERLRLSATLDVKTDLRYVMLTLPLPAGMEAREPDEDRDAWWGDFAIRDDRVEVALAEATAQKWIIHIPVYATVPGRFFVRGPSAFAMYDPDRMVRGPSTTLTIR